MSRRLIYCEIKITKNKKDKSIEPFSNVRNDYYKIFEKPKSPDLSFHYENFSKNVEKCIAPLSEVLNNESVQQF